MKSGLETNTTADGTWTNFNFSKSKDFTYSPQHNRYVFNGNDTFKVNGKSTLKDKTKNWITKSVKTKAFDKVKNSLLNHLHFLE